MAKAMSKVQSKRTSMTIKEREAMNDRLVKEIESIPNKFKLDLFRRTGLGNEYFTCYMCGEVKQRTDFYVSTDPACKSGVTRICKSCCYELAHPINIRTGQPSEPTMESIKNYLEYVDKPFINAVWDSCVIAANSETPTNGMNGKTGLFGQYAGAISLGQHAALRWREGDVFKSDMEDVPMLTVDGDRMQAIIEQYEKNKSDTLRLLGYDPFELEQEEDKPFLYAQFIGYCDIDEDISSDMMRVSSIIEIVKGFSHIEKMNNIISNLMNDTKRLDKNIATIRALEDTKSKITGSIQKLAMESCISLKNNKSVKRGDDTFTGRTRKLRDMNLRDAEVNGFDIGTCRGMRQVADISNQSILNKIRLDENDYSEMLAEQRIMIQKYIAMAEKYEEQARILLRENFDLKEYLKEIGRYDESMFTSDTILYRETDDEEEDEEFYYDPPDEFMAKEEPESVTGGDSNG